MSKLELNSLSNSIMTQKQLIDSLTSHISLYHSHSLPSSSCSIHSSNNQRSSILKWFSYLSVHHRQAHLTVVDSNFVQTLIRMLGTLHNRGHGLFIILPDLPSGDNLPSVCFKKSLGLLSRVSESNRAQRRIFEATMLFASREGERIDECSCSVKNIDTITVSEDFVDNLDEFVEFMDGLSNGRFLRGEESELGSDWVELEWMKAKGYYSIEAFVANRLEVSMRLAWLNCNSGKKRGVKLKEKASAAGVAANVYWRKKGCVSWWENLDAATKRKIFVSVLGKAAKPLTNKILKGTSGALEDEIWLFNTGVQRRLNLRYSHTVSERKTVSALANDNEFGLSIIPASSSGRPAYLTNAFNSLLVLQDVVMMLSLFLNSELDQGRIFFSTLSSICTISDFVLRKVRGFLMVISLDYTKLELISEESDKSLCNKSKGNASAYSRKKKGRNRNLKRIKAVPGSCMDGLLHDKSMKSTDFKMANGEKVTVTDSRKLPDDPPKKDNCREPSSSKVEMDHAHILIAGKSLTAAKKSKKGKGKNKNKNSGSKDPVEDINCGISHIEASSSFISQSEASQSKVVSHDIIPCNISNDNSADKEILALKLTPCHSNEPIKENDAYQNIQEKIKIDSSASFPHKSQDCYHHFSTYMVENQMKSCLETLDCKDNQNMNPYTFIDCNDLNNKDYGLEKYVSANQPDGKSASLEIRSFALKKECVLAPEKKSGNASYMGISSSSDCLPSEWPSMATTYFSPVNSHLPAATDRLHLDVGRNWHNHFHQSFLPTVHHGRNTPADGGHNSIMSRRSSMSLDWPPMVRGACGLVPPVTYSYDPGLISSRHCTFAQGISPCSLQLHATADDERRYSGDFTDLPDLTSAHELADECDNHWISEDELEVHAVSGIDYNQYFGDGVMYWNPSDNPGTGFSRPPSLSSDDSSWAWREADMIRAVDDMVTFSSSYSTNGLTSPTASFCSPFDPIGPSQSLGYAIPGNEVPGKLLCSPSTMQDAAMEEETTVAMPDLTIDVEGKSGDLLPYPMLRPIIIPNMSRERSRSEFKGSHDHKSPCVPPSKREQPQVKRPPSPVVLCVPRAPCPPPPSPASDSRKQRGFPTVRSGSSSPRHWGMRGWFHDGANVEEACLRVDGAEVVWPSWRGNNFSTCSMIQPLPAALLQDRLIAISQLARDQEHPDVALPLQPPELQSCLSRKTSPSLMHTFLHEEIDSFCKQVSAENLARKPYITWAVKRVRRSLQVLWPRSRTNIFGSNATGLSLPTSDVDLVVCLPPVRNLEPIKEAGILEGRNGIKETCLQHAARYLVNQDWVKNDSLKTVENTAIPIIMLVVEVPSDLIVSSACNASPKEEPPHIYGEQSSNVQSDPAVLEESALSKCSQTNNDIAKDSIPVRLDISFKSPSHTGLQTTGLVKDLMEQFPAATPLALVLKQFLADRSLDQSYSGGLSSYCLILLIIRFLQHEHHHGRPINQNFGSLLMDFLYFFGNVFDPRQIRISVQGSGVYIKRERGCSIDPIHIDDPLYPTNNVGRNCFRIHQCIKAFSEAYSTLEKELGSLPNDVESCSKPSYVLLRKIIPSIGLS